MNIRMPWTTAIPIILFGLFILIAGLNWLFQEYSQVVSLQNSGADFIVVVFFATFGLVLIQLGFRSMSDKHHDPARHIISAWILYPVGAFWTLLGLLAIVESSLYGLLPLSIGTLILYYVYKRPASRDPKPIIRVEMPIENPNLWTQLFIGRKLHFVLIGGYLVGWITPWELVSYIPMHQEFVNHLIPYLPGLGALRDEASNPAFAVGLMSFVVLIIPIALLITVIKSQTADRVVSREYPISDAWKALLLSLAAMPIIVWVYVGVPDGDTVLQNLVKENKLALSLQQVSYFWGGNAVFMIILSLAKGIFRYYRQGARL